MNLLFLSSAAIFSIALVCSTQHQHLIADGFIPTEQRRFASSRRDSDWDRRLAYSSEDDMKNEDTSWSRSGEQERSGRFGVRSRVREVLKKARDRTGIRNSSEESRDVFSLAEAASIGGLGEEGDVVLTVTKPKKKNGSRSPSDSAAPVDRINGDLTMVDGLRADVPTAPKEPLPFKIPELTDEQRSKVLAGERLQEQSKMGREGSGFVVMDVKAPPIAIWETLLDFESYPETIPTVRDMKLFTSRHLSGAWEPYWREKQVDPGTGRETRRYGKASATRAAFTLSKFRLNIAAIHNYRPHPDGDFMIFTLDPACTNVVLQSAKGIWHTQSNPDGRGEVSFSQIVSEVLSWSSFAHS